MVLTYACKERVILSVRSGFFRKNNPDRMIQIVVADDHAVVRTGLQLIFSSAADLEIAGEASNAGELIQVLKKRMFDLVVLDMSMPGRDSMDALREIKTRWPDLPVVIFTMNPEDNYALRMLSAGASAYINKEQPPEVLIKAIRMAAAGKRFVTTDQAEMLMEQLLPDKKNNAVLELTDRELQVMRLIALGKNKNEIAESLQISKNTISNHRNNILKKLGLQNTADITRFAVSNRII